MSNSRFFYKTIPTKAYVVIGLTTIALTTALHFFMLYAVFPKEGGVISLYVPAKSGGKDFIITPDEFLVASYIALAVTILGTVATMLLLRAKKRLEATIALLWVVALSTMYLATYGGNALDEMWGGPWSIIGVIAVIIVGFSLEIPLIGAMARSMKKP